MEGGHDGVKKDQAESRQNKPNRLISVERWANGSQLTVHSCDLSVALRREKPKPRRVAGRTLSDMNHM